jgi:hypothetical protein
MKVHLGQGQSPLLLRSLLTLNAAATEGRAMMGLRDPSPAPRPRRGEETAEEEAEELGVCHKWLKILETMLLLLEEDCN